MSLGRRNLRITAESGKCAFPLARWISSAGASAITPLFHIALGMISSKWDKECATNIRDQPFHAARNTKCKAYNRRTALTTLMPTQVFAGKFHSWTRTASFIGLYYDLHDINPKCGGTVTDTAATASELWPDLPLDSWNETCATLHMWFQIVGKIRITQCRWVNHSWHVALYVTARGLTTTPIPHGMRNFQIDFDFIDHRLTVQASDGSSAGFTLEPLSVADFYKRLMREMQKLNLGVSISRKPNEVTDPIPFDQDEVHRAYDRDYANRFWRILVQADRVFKMFRARFIGKCSPVHFFWGSPDLAVTRFSGRSAPVHPGGIPNLPDWVTREAYSHEVSSCGFWYGGGPIPYPAFYSYAYPEPAGFSHAPVSPHETFYSNDLHEFVLAYDIVRKSASPDDTLLDFLQTTYEAAADLANWDRKTLERDLDPGKQT